MKILFDTSGLLSKFGFKDGDILDDIWFDVEDSGIEPKIDRHQFLIKVVKELLIPKIDNNIELLEIDTIHNPIRASKVDGIDINSFDDNNIIINPKFIEIESELLEKFLVE